MATSPELKLPTNSLHPVTGLAIPESEIALYTRSVSAITGLSTKFPLLSGVMYQEPPDCSKMEVSASSFGLIVDMYFPVFSLTSFPISM
ncbi:hypothetical protein D1872_245760 [compost metagenome]